MIKKTLLEYCAGYAALTPSEKEKRRIYQKIVRQTTNSRYFGQRYMNTVLRYAMSIGIVAVLFVSATLYIGGGSIFSPSQIQETRADRVGDVVSVEGYFEVFSQGQRTVTATIRLNDIVMIDKDARIEVDLADSFRAIITGPAKVLIRYNEQNQKYRLTMIEGGNVKIESLKKEEKNPSVEVETADGTIVSPQSLTQGDVSISQSTKTTTIVNNAPAPVTIIPKNTKTTPVSLPLSKTIAIPQTTIGLQGLDTESVQTIVETIGSENIVMNSEGAPLAIMTTILATENSSPGSVVPSISGTGGSGIVGSGIIGSDTVVVINDTNTPSDQQSSLNQLTTKEERTEMAKNIETIVSSPVLKSVSQDRLANITYRLSNEHKELLQKVSLAYLQGDSSFPILHQELYTQIMRTYSALGIRYPAREYGIQNTIRAVGMLYHLTKSGREIDPAVIHNIRVTNRWMQRISQQKTGNMTKDDAMVHITEIQTIPMYQLQ